MYVNICKSRQSGCPDDIARAQKSILENQSSPTSIVGLNSPNPSHLFLGNLFLRAIIGASLARRLIDEDPGECVE